MQITNSHDLLVNELLKLPEVTPATKLPLYANIIALGTRDLRDLTTGKTYQAIYGLEEGIFTSRPFVTIIDDCGKQRTLHASRFRLPQ